MKFICEKCNTKYSIADEKVRRKVLKIRCKNCGNVVVVRDPNRESAAAPATKSPTASGANALSRAFDGAFGSASLGTGSSGGSAAARGSGSPAGSQQRALKAVANAPVIKPITEEFPEDEKTSVSGAIPSLLDPKTGAPHIPPEQTDDEWYLAVDGAQYGPMSFDELASRVKRGEARGDDVHVWCDGFDDWMEVKKVPELRPYVPPPPPPRSGLFPAPLLNENLGDSRSKPPIPPPPAGGTPPPRPLSAMTPLGTPLATQLPSGRPPAQPQHAPAGAVGGVGAVGAVPPVQGNHPSAVVAQPELMHAALESGLRHLPQSYASERPEVALPPQLVPTVPPAKTPLVVKLAAIGGIISTLMGVAFLVYFLFLQPDKKPDKQPAKTTLGTAVAANQPRQPIEVSPKSKDAGGPMVFRPDPVGRTAERHPSKGGRHPVRRPAAKRHATQPDTTAGRKLSAADRRLLASMGGAKGSSLDRVPVKSGAARRKIPTRELTGGELQQMVRRNMRGLKACWLRAAKRDNTLKALKANIWFSIGASGVVNKVKATGVDNFTLKRCLLNNVKRWVFKPIGGRGTNAEFPLVFRAN
jgi:predicted Zn finger-like uncharacterized protein